MSNNNENGGANPVQPKQSIKQQPRKLPARFYNSVSVESNKRGHRLLLDNRPVITPKRKTLEVPTQKLALAIKAEWAQQDTHIDPETMPLTRLVNTALDGIAGQEDAVIQDIAKYAANDALCYRAQSPDDLINLQQAAWDPLLSWADRELGMALKTTKGIMPVTQPEATRNKAAAILKAYGPLELGAIHVLTTLSGSLVLALALVRGHITPDEAWTKAHIDEDYQISQWGEDDEARSRRADRQAQFNSAHRLLALLD